MTITKALRIARSEFPPVTKTRGSRLWGYDTMAPGAKSCGSTDYFAAVRTKNIETIRYALVLIGWPDERARAFVATIDGRGTHYDMMMQARAWLAQRVEDRRVAA